MANEKANKIVLGDETLIDLTSDTVTPATLGNGITAHAADGSSITGEAAFLDPTQITASQYDIAPGKQTFIKEYYSCSLASIFNDNFSLTCNVDDIYELSFSTIKDAASFPTNYKNRALSLTIKTNAGSISAHSSSVSFSIDKSFIDTAALEAYLGQSISSISSQYVYFYFGSYYYSSGRYYITYGSRDTNVIFFNPTSPTPNLHYQSSISSAPSRSRFYVHIKDGAISSCYFNFYCASKSNLSASTATYTLSIYNHTVAMQYEVPKIGTGYYCPLYYKGRRIKSIFWCYNVFEVQFSSASGICYSQSTCSSSGYNGYALPFGTIVIEGTAAKTRKITLTPNTKYGSAAVSATITISVADADLYYCLVPLDALTVLIFYRFETRSASIGWSQSKLYCRMISVSAGVGRISGEVTWEGNRADSTGSSGSLFTASSRIIRLGLDNNEFGIVQYYNITTYKTVSGSQENVAAYIYYYFNNLRRRGHNTIGLRSTAWTTLVNGVNTLTTYGQASCTPIPFFGASYCTQTTETNSTNYVATEPYGGLYGAVVATNVNSVAANANNGFVSFNSFTSNNYVGKIKENIYILLNNSFSRTGSSSNVCKLTNFYLFTWEEASRVATNVHHFVSSGASLAVEYNCTITLDWQSIVDTSLPYTYVDNRLIENMYYLAFNGPGGYYVFGFDLSVLPSKVYSGNFTLTAVGFFKQDITPYRTAKKYEMAAFYDDDKIIDPFDGYAFELET